MPGQKYQITFTRFNTDKSGIGEYFTFQDDDLVKILTQLQIAIAIICKKETEAEVLKIKFDRIKNDNDDIPF